MDSWSTYGSSTRCPLTTSRASSIATVSPGRPATRFTSGASDPGTRTTTRSPRDSSSTSGSQTFTRTLSPVQMVGLMLAETTLIGCTTKVPATTTATTTVGATRKVDRRTGRSAVGEVVVLAAVGADRVVEVGIDRLPAHRELLHHVVVLVAEVVAVDHVAPTLVLELHDHVDRLVLADVDHV